MFTLIPARCRGDDECPGPSALFGAYIGAPNWACREHPSRRCSLPSSRGAGAATHRLLGRRTIEYILTYPRRKPRQKSSQLTLRSTTSQMTLRSSTSLARIPCTSRPNCETGGGGDPDLGGCGGRCSVHPQRLW